MFNGVTENGVTVAPLSPLREAHILGNPVPSIVLTNFGDVMDGTTGSFAVTTGRLFTFQSFDLGMGGAGGPRYSVTGFLNDVEIFSDAGQNPNNGWFTILSGNPFASLDRLVITAYLVDVTGATLSTSANFDNIVIGLPSSPVPEPGTLALLGLGLVGIGLRRRVARAG